MVTKSDETLVCDMTDRYVIFSLGILYAGICPVATIVVFLFNIVDIILLQTTDINI